MVFYLPSQNKMNEKKILVGIFYKKIFIFI